MKIYVLYIPVYLETVPIYHQLQRLTEERNIS
jgi:hypothetical protein